MGASKLLLQVLGVIQDKGTSINIFSGGGNGSDSSLSQLNDDDLDKEINRLSAEVYPLDVRAHGGKIYPIEDAYVEEVAE
jgi:hypothetical protein